MAFGDIGGGVSVAEQSVNVNQVNGSAISASNPVPVSGPVTSPDGGIVAVGSTSDATYVSGSGTLIALLKGLFARLSGTLVVQGVAGGVAQPISGTVAISNNVGVSGAVAFTSPPATTTANADTPLTFASQVKRVALQNNTGSNVNLNFDATASPGTYLLTPGSSLFLDLQCTVLHVYTTTALAINGATGGNIVVQGWM